MRGALAVLLTVPLLALAGCAKEPAANADVPAPGSPADPATLATPAPAWEKGMWWNFTSEQLGGGFTMVVADDQGADWVVATDHANTAFFDTLSDISYLGPQRKADLAGSQGDQRVEFFRWPLTDGLNWTTTWDGEPVTIEASRVGDGAFRMVARNATDEYAVYTYDAAVGWFTQLSFFTPGGDVGFAMALQDSGSGYSGTLASWELQQVVARDTSLAGAPEQATFPVPAGVTDVWIRYSLACTQGLAGVAVGPLPIDNQRGVFTNKPCPYAQGETVWFPTHAPPQGGDETWGWSVSSNAGASGDYALTILLRTLHRTPMA